MPRYVFALITLFALASHTSAGEVRIAVASNFMAPMKVMAAQFERDTGHTVLASYGSTGKFYAQIRNGAPFDILLAADDETPARLDREGAAVASTRFTYAIGQLVLWSAQAGLVDDQGRLLMKGNFAHLALADPKLAPYGAAALEVLQKMKLDRVLAPKLVLGENIAQTHQFVASGAATLGFVSSSQVLDNGKLTSGSAWPVPADLHAPIRQDAVLLAQGKGKPAAEAFLSYLKGEKAGMLITTFGYGR
ncbi:MAG: molybdate ABC transporter substrate-binding protein [Pseudomonadota bacterium]